MDIASVQTVTLPDGRKVNVSATEEPWWSMDDTSGYVDPHTIAADPDQPRRFMKATDLEELEESVRECGVRQHIVVTPRHLAPWARVLPEEEHCFFLNVSGHRRKKCAVKSGQRAVPIHIRVYADQDAHERDRSVLNAAHSELTALEEGWEMLNHRERGWKIEKIARTFGKSVPEVYRRINLTRLHPEIQALLSPELEEKKRLSVVVGSALGGLKEPTREELLDLYRKFGEGLPGFEHLADLDEEEEDFEEESDSNDRAAADVRRFTAQKLLLAYTASKYMSGVRAAAFIKDESHHLEASRGHSGAGRPVTRFEPRKRKEVIKGLVKLVTGSPVMDWNPRELERIFDLSSREEIEEVIGQLKSVTGFLEGLITVLERLRDRKQPMRPETRRIMEQRARAAGG